MARSLAVEHVLANDDKPPSSEEGHRISAQPVTMIPVCLRHTTSYLGVHTLNTIHCSRCTGKNRVRLTSRIVTLCLSMFVCPASSDDTASLTHRILFCLHLAASNRHANFLHGIYTASRGATGGSASSGCRLDTGAFGLPVRTSRTHRSNSACGAGD
eukprot:4393975-Amphidinium_carterae.2